MSPSIDKGQAGSKTVRVNRTAFWQIRCRGEPPPTFKWVHPVHGELKSNEHFTVLTDEYQGGATTTLVIHHATGQDNGTYTLQAENRLVRPYITCSQTDSYKMYIAHIILYSAAVISKDSRTPLYSAVFSLLIYSAVLPLLCFVCLHTAVFSSTP